MIYTNESHCPRLWAWKEKTLALAHNKSNITAVMDILQNNFIQIVVLSDFLVKGKCQFIFTCIMVSFNFVEFESYSNESLSKGEKIKVIWPSYRNIHKRILNPLIYCANKNS